MFPISGSSLLGYFQGTPPTSKGYEVGFSLIGYKASKGASRMVELHIIHDNGQSLRYELGKVTYKKKKKK